MWREDRLQRRSISHQTTLCKHTRSIRSIQFIHGVHETIRRGTKLQAKVSAKKYGNRDKPCFYQGHQRKVRPLAQSHLLRANVKAAKAQQEKLKGKGPSSDLEPHNEPGILALPSIFNGGLSLNSRVTPKTRNASLLGNDSQNDRDHLLAAPSLHMPYQNRHESREWRYNCRGLRMQGTGVTNRFTAPRSGHGPKIN